MTLRELFDTLKCLGVKITLHDGDTISIEPPDVLTPAARAALTEHHAALVALIRSGPSSTSSFDALMSAFDGVGARPSAELLQERLRTLAAGLAGADPLVRELVRAEAIARLDALGVRAPARLVDAALTAPLRDAGPAAPRRWLLFPDPPPLPAVVERAAPPRVSPRGRPHDRAHRPPARDAGRSGHRPAHAPPRARGAGGPDPSRRAPPPARPAPAPQRPLGRRSPGGAAGRGPRRPRG